MKARLGGGVLALGLAVRATTGTVLQLAAPAGALVAGAGFPIFVASNPHRFGPERMASPVGGAAFDREGQLAATVADDPLPGMLDTRPTGAVAPPAEGDAPRVRRRSREWGAPRPYGVVAVAGGAALIEHAGGAEMVRPGAVLPDGRRLLAVRADGTLETAPVGPVAAARPAQADLPTLPIEPPVLVRD